MNMKLISLLVAVVIVLLGVVVLMLGGKPDASSPTAAAAPSPTAQPKPNPRAGSFKRSDPDKNYGYESPK